MCRIADQDVLGKAQRVDGMKSEIGASLFSRLARHLLIRNPPAFHDRVYYLTNVPCICLIPFRLIWSWGTFSRKEGSSSPPFPLF